MNYTALCHTTADAAAEFTTQHFTTQQLMQVLADAAAEFTISIYAWMHPSASTCAPVRVRPGPIIVHRDTKFSYALVDAFAM